MARCRNEASHELRKDTASQSLVLRVAILKLGRRSSSHHLARLLSATATMSVVVVVVVRTVGSSPSGLALLSRGEIAWLARVVGRRLLKVDIIESLIGRVIILVLVEPGPAVVATPSLGVLTSIGRRASVRASGGWLGRRRLLVVLLRGRIVTIRSAIGMGEGTVGGRSILMGLGGRKRVSTVRRSILLRVVGRVARLRLLLPLLRRRVQLRLRSHCLA